MRFVMFAGLLWACGGGGGGGGADAPTDGPEAIAIQTECTLPIAIATTMDTDVAYGSDPAQRFDIARPAIGGTYPLVMMVHGGGWSAGSKADFRDLMLGVASQGYVAASIGYRLVTSTANRFPTAVQDSRCALRTLRDRAAQYAIDPTRAVVLGGSAGAHLASLLGVAPDEPAFDGTCAATSDTRIDGVVSVAGPQDLRDAGDYPAPTQPILDAFFGHTPSADPDNAALASPITHVDASDPPFLLIHGTIDDVVPFEQSELMQRALWGANVPATLVSGVYGHTTPPPNQADAATITCTLAAFLDETLR